MIYFLQEASGGPVKIGYSQDVDARHRQLESHYGRPLTLLGTMPGGRDEEREIHARFGHLRFGRTEQFRPSPELAAFIGSPILVTANPAAVEVMPTSSRSATIIHLKGSPEYVDWLAAVHKKTRLPKAVIFRMALEDWAKSNGHDAPPEI